MLIPRLFTRIILCLSLTFPLLIGCATKTQTGAATGAAAGALVGAVIGHQSGERDKGALLGAALGTAIGAAAGRRLDKQQAELERIAETRRTEQGLIVTLAENKVYFASNSTVVSAPSRNTLLDLGAVLKKYPENVITIVGHTDSQGSGDYNLKLSERRAQSVGDVLADAGVPMNTMYFRGYGETQPVASNDTAAGRAENRRVELNIRIDESKIPKQ